MIWIFVALQAISLFGFWHVSAWCALNRQHIVALMKQSRADIDLITALSRSNKEAHDRIAELEATLIANGIYH